MNLGNYESIIEAILFASGEEVSLERIAHCIGLDEKTTRSILRNLADKYDTDRRGIQIIEINNTYQMCTNSEYFEYISKLVNAPPKKVLTQALMETLAIIAYKQPITKGQIEEIRGVNADHAVNRLMEFELICEMGRLDAPGRPILFGTADAFLKYFGFKNLNELPKIQPNSLEDYSELHFDEMGLKT